MKMLPTFLIAICSILQVAAAEPSGLYLRMVVGEDTEGAVRMTREDGTVAFVSRSSIITPDDVDTAKVSGADPVSIKFEFKPSGQAKLGEATRAMIGKQLAIVVDGRLLSTPVVQSEFSTGANITGNFTREWADTVVERVRANRKN